MAAISGASIFKQAPPRQAAARITSFRSASLFNRRNNNLSFNLRHVPVRLTVSCSAKRETVDKVCKIVKKQLSLSDNSPVTSETKFADLGADSLDTVEIVMGLEEEFGITMAEEKAQSIATVEQAAELIEELLQEKRA